MPLHVPVPASVVADVSAAAVWAYANRVLTNPAVASNLLNMLVGISPTATGRAALLDLITAARMAELDPANMPGDIDTILARLTAARAGYLDNLNNPQLLNLPQVNIMEHEIGFASAEALNDIALTGEQTTTERTITVTLPTGATIRRVFLLAVITAMNNTVNAQKIDVTVQGRKGAGGWNNYFSQDDIVGFGAVDGATTSMLAIQDVSALVNEAVAYGFRLSVNQSSANSVRYTTQYVLLITYRMS